MPVNSLASMESNNVNKEGDTVMVFMTLFTSKTAASKKQIPMLNTKIYIFKMIGRNNTVIIKSDA